MQARQAVLPQPYALQGSPRSGPPAERASAVLESVLVQPCSLLASHCAAAGHLTQVLQRLAHWSQPLCPPGRSLPLRQAARKQQSGTWRARRLAACWPKALTLLPCHSHDDECCVAQGEAGHPVHRVPGLLPRGLALLAGCRPQRRTSKLSLPRQVPSITPRELDALLHGPSAQRVVMVDTRTDEERAVSRIPGKVLTKEEFEQQKAEYRDSTVVAYCTAGLRSGKFLKPLQAEGYDTKNLKGSIVAWVRPCEVYASPCQSLRPQC